MTASEAQTGDRLQLMETFVRIVEAGSLSAAAAQLRTTQPTVSRRLKLLERSLGVRLLQRTTHVMRLTVDGERCFQRAKELLASWAAFEADLRGAQEEPEGTLRVAMPHAFGQDRFVAPMAAFLREHPRVAVEWLLRDEVRDFIAAGIDCAIQVGEPADPAVIAVKLSEVPRIVVAAPSLIAAAGAPPEDPDDLAALPWLALRTFYLSEVALTHARTGETRRLRIRPRFSTDSLFALRSAALEGLGVCVGSAWLLTQDLAQGRLLHVAPRWQAPPLPVYLTYPQARFYPSRLLRFVATMRAAVPELLADDRRRAR
ncbi:LysR family transcriptional regulator [Nannocystis bainbridge]|uniref:LysR family transcriptional regulator n=1 Tax=Nannocystis bainbridge TaxID=2995303 RepID=A0ABT5E6N1_9BACT|nr:LysR family transcriptional regulator [Nannocystis bainbridge]MDC0721070.1 LysR family transcriptional regulator [Nannocystis bainbridge]